MSHGSPYASAGDLSVGRKHWFRFGEFVAHAGASNCACIGGRTDQLVATGGDDGKINVWKIGSPAVIRSLSGHSAPVEAVRFSHSEERVIGGSQSGSVKVFDVSTSRVVKTLNGHRSNCRALDMHPYNSVIASGSYDTNLKLWDLRRGKEFFTFKGHSDHITTLRFSPDGKWVVSGSADTTVKIWDLTAGKLMQTFDTHRGPVRTLDFHPFEFLLASAGDDRVVKYWNLESFGLAASSPLDTKKLLSVKFVANGSALLAATEDGVKVHEWVDRPRIRHTIDVPWRRVAATHLMQSGKMLACAANQSFVSVWGVDVWMVDPSLHPDGEAAGVAGIKAAEAARAASGEPAGTGEDSMGNASAGGGTATSTPPRRPGRSSSDRTPPSGSGGGRSSGDRGSRGGRGSDERRQPRGAAGSRREGGVKPSARLWKSVLADEDEAAAAHEGGAAAGAGVGDAAGAGGVGGSGSGDRGRPPRRAISTPERGARSGNDGGDGRIVTHAPFPAAPGPREMFTATAGKSSGTDVETLAAEMAAAGVDVRVPTAPSPVVPLSPTRRDASVAARSPAPPPAPPAPHASDAEPGSRVNDRAGGGAAAAAGPHHEHQSRERRDRLSARAGAATGAGGSDSGSATSKEGDEDRRRGHAGDSAGNGAQRRASRSSAVAKDGKTSGGDAGNSSSSSSRKAAVASIKAKRNEPAQLRYADFLTSGASGASTSTALAPVSAITAEMVHDRSSFMTVMQRRLARVKVTASMWTSGNLRSTLNHLAMASDPSLTADFLRMVNLQSPAIKLSSAVTILPLIVDLLSSTFEDYSLVALTSLAELFDAFSPFVRETRAAATMVGGRVGVDVSREERLERCNSAHESFVRALPVVKALGGRPGMLGQRARGVTERMNEYLAKS